MPRKVREVLEKVGDNTVLKIQLGRTPVEAFLILFLNLISKYKFVKKQVELGYDEIYHNYLLITIQNEKGPAVLQTMIANSEDIIPSTVYKLDKAHRIRLMKPEYPAEFVDIYDIPVTPNKTFTLNRLITTASNVDKHFYLYDAANNNMCQTFVENIVDINGLTSNIIDEATRIALKPQDARALIATLGSRSDIVKHVTDLGGTLDKLVNDRAVKWKRSLNKEFSLFGHMYVKKADDITRSNSEEILQSTNDGTVSMGDATDTILENTDDIFNAVVALEKEEQQRRQRNKMIIIIVGSILAAILLVGIVYFIWRKRKGKDMKEEIVDKNIEKVESTSNISEATDTTEN